MRKVLLVVLSVLVCVIIGVGLYKITAPTYVEIGDFTIVGDAYGGAIGETFTMQTGLNEYIKVQKKQCVNMDKCVPGEEFHGVIVYDDDNTLICVVRQR